MSLTLTVAGSCFPSLSPAVRIKGPCIHFCAFCSACGGNRSRFPCCTWLRGGLHAIDTNLIKAKTQHSETKLSRSDLHAEAHEVFSRPRCKSAGRKTISQRCKLQIAVCFAGSYLKNEPRLADRIRKFMFHVGSLQQGCATLIFHIRRF